MVIYPVDSAIQLLNNCGQIFIVSNTCWSLNKVEGGCSQLRKVAANSKEVTFNEQFFYCTALLKQIQFQDARMGSRNAKF